MTIMNDIYRIYRSSLTNASTDMVNTIAEPKTNKLSKKFVIDIKRKKHDLKPNEHPFFINALMRSVISRKLLKHYYFHFRMVINITNQDRLTAIV